MIKKTTPPKIAAIHDLSCFGRCALTVILPTLSVMGYQTVPVPTALLSTHTGGFDNLYFRDLTDGMDEIADHFSRLQIGFRAIYTGFLGSEKQISSVRSFINRFSDIPDESGERPLVLIDPVMGDDGELYSTYTPELARGIRELCAHADVITPNLTEACFLTDIPYRDTACMSEKDAFSYVGSMMDILTDRNPHLTVITGIRLSDGSVANLLSDRDGSRHVVRQPECGASYPGTGDIFASVLLGKLLAGESFYSACEAAADFTAHLIRISCDVDSETRRGVALEPELWRLLPQRSANK